MLNPLFKFKIILFRKFFCVALSLTSVASGQVRLAGTPESGPNLLAQPLGVDDLLVVSVFDEPDFTGTVRVRTDGSIRIPMLKQQLKVQGLMPSEVETKVSEALRAEHLFVDPLVTVTIAEFNSYPISVAGALNQPTTFQATSSVSLLEAITRAGGLTAEAGPEIMVSHTRPRPDGAAEPPVHRILVKELMNGANPSSNVALRGGDEVRVPDKRKIYVIGNVKMPGGLAMDDTEFTVLQALALCQGLTPYAAKEAYIYRVDSDGTKNEIVIPLRKIMERQAPDSAVLANDILYVPDNKSRRLTIETLEKVLLLGTGAGAAAIYTIR